MSGSITGENSLPEGWVAEELAAVYDLNPPKPPSDKLAADALVTFVPMPAVDADARAIHQTAGPCLCGSP